jgi:cytochrome c biogenesis protein CcmG, thiol:disulfide interchange protein DsbE
MNRFLLPIGIFALLVVVLAIGIKRAPEKGVIQSVLIGKPAPAFRLPELGVPGQSVDSRALAGRWYVLNVWGTWCFECRAEHDALLAIKLEGRVPLIGLNWKDEDPAALQWLQELGNPYEHVAVDADGRTAIDFGVYGAPESFLVNDRGIIVHKYVGPMSAEVWQKQFLSRMPAASPPVIAPTSAMPATVGAGS